VIKSIYITEHSAAEIYITKSSHLVKFEVDRNGHSGYPTVGDAGL